MLPKLIGYLVLLPALLGLGSAVFLWISRFITIEPDFGNLVFFVTAGLAVLGVVSDILNFFTAIAPPIPLMMVIIGWILLIFNRKRIKAALFPAESHLSARIVILAVILLVFTAYYTQRGFIQGDATWYHFPALKWIAESPLPLGLAQLNSRFGYNYQWFPIAAMMNVVGDVDHLSSFLLGGLLLWPFALIVWEALTRRLAARPSQLFLALSVISWGMIMFLSPKEVTVFTPNMPVAVLAILITYATLRSLEVDQGWQYYLTVVMFLVVFSVLIKISAAMFVFAPPFILAYKARQLHLSLRDFWGAVRRQIIVLLPLVLLLVIPWLIRGVSLSGCLFYPVIPTCIPSLEWSLDLQRVSGEATGILVSGRQRYNADSNEILTTWHWLPFWWGDTIGQARVQAMLAIVAIGAALWAALIVITRRRSLFHGQLLFVVAAAMLVITTIFWFLTAPDVKFIYGSFSSLGALLVASAIFALNEVYPDLWLRVANTGTRVLSLLPILLILWTGAKVGQAVLEKNRDLLFNWPSIGSFPVQELHTSSGDAVYVPDGGMCANNPRPCADYPDELHFTIKRDAQGNIREFVRDDAAQP